MPTFYLSEDTISRLSKKFEEFQEARKKVHELITSYIADYRQFRGKVDDRQEFLEEKYIPQAPNLSHLVCDDTDIFFNVSDIAIILGRSQQAISSTLLKMEQSEGWISRLLPLRKQTKTANGNKIFVYAEEIFDLLIDRYEEEYLLRFTRPRRGNANNAPDIQEVRKYWNYLKEVESRNDSLALKEHEIILPDIPPMSIKDILNVIWKKVFDIKVDTVCSVIFAVCFEVARRFLAVSLWVSIVPIAILFAVIFLIYRRKFSADTLSDIGAGALLFLLLWISGSVSLYRYESPKIAQKIALSPQLHNNGLYSDVYFNISAVDTSDIKEFLFRISPDTQFRSTGFLQQIDATHNLPYPSTLIRNNVYKGIAHIDVKYIDFSGNESKTWKFSFDIDAERFKLCKETILYTNIKWVGIKQYSYDNTTNIFVYPDLLTSYQGKNSIKSIMYGINTDQPDTKIELQYFLDNWMKVLNPYLIFSTEDDYIKSVSSYLIFNDGTSSDIRISRIKD